LYDIAHWCTITNHQSTTVLLIKLVNNNIVYSILLFIGAE